MLEVLDQVSREDNLVTNEAWKNLAEPREHWRVRRGSGLNLFGVV